MAPSTNYTEDDLQRLLADLNVEGVPVSQRYLMLRESADWLPPALDITLYLAAGVGGGILGAIGSDAWAKFKRVVGRAESSELAGRRPHVSATVEFDGKRSSLNVRGEKPEHVSQVLDTALPKLESVGLGYNLWYVREIDAWLTVNELIAWMDTQLDRDQNLGDGNAAPGA